MKTPQLSYGKNKNGQDCWQLFGESNDGRVVVKLEIRYYHGDPAGLNHYTTLAAEDGGDLGGYREVLTYSQMNKRSVVIEQNEGAEAADAWEKNFEQEHMLSTPTILEIANELKQRWEAMLTLNLFTPNINN